MNIQCYPQVFQMSSSTTNSDNNPFRRYLSLSPNVVYQIHMQNIINSHRHIGMNLFKEINDCVQLHASEHHNDFASCKMYSREELVAIVTDLYNLHGMKPTMNHVTLNDNGGADVPTFDVKTMLLSIINNQTRMLLAFGFKHMCCIKV